MTSAPASRRRRTTHPPTSPVAPVTNTGRSLQNDDTELLPGIDSNGLGRHLSRAKVRARSRGSSAAVRTGRTWRRAAVRSAARTRRPTRGRRSSDTRSPSEAVRRPRVRRNTSPGATAGGRAQRSTSIAIDRAAPACRAPYASAMTGADAGGTPSRNALNAVMPVPPANEDHVAALDDEVAVRQLDPHLRALVEGLLHPLGERSVDGVRDPERVPLG